MTNDHSEDDTVLSLHYQGYSRKEINDKTRISAGKISGFVSKEKVRLGSGLVEAIKRVGKELHRSGNTWTDMADAMTISNYCKKHSLDLEELKDSLPAIVEKLDERGLGLSDLPMDIEDKVQEKEKLASSVNTLKDEMEGLEQNQAKKLKDAGHTEESIARCRELTDFLKDHKISTDAPEKLRNAILNAEENGYDGMALTEKVSGIDSLAAMKKTLDGTLEEKKTEIEKAEIAVEAQRTEHWKDKEAIDAWKILKEKGAKNSDMLAIKDLVEKEGSDLPTLSSKVASYGSLDNATREMEKRIRELAPRNAELETSVPIFEERKTIAENVAKEYEEKILKETQSVIGAVNDGIKKISEAGDAASSKITAIGEKADEVTNRYAKTQGILAFEALIRSVHGEKVHVSNVRDAAVLAMNILLARLPTMSDNRLLLESLIKKLKDDTSIDIFS